MSKAEAIELVHTTAMRHGVDPAAILGNDRTRPVSLARNEVYAVLRDWGYSSRMIGYWLGRNHRSVLHGEAAYKAAQKRLLKRLGMV